MATATPLVWFHSRFCCAFRVLLASSTAVLGFPGPPLAGDARSHARQEFSSLESWLSAPSTLRLALAPNRAPAADQRPRGATLAASGAPAARRGHGDVGRFVCPARELRSG